MISRCLGDLGCRVLWEDHMAQNNLELMRTLDDGGTHKTGRRLKSGFQGAAAAQGAARTRALAKPRVLSAKGKPSIIARL